MSTSLQIDTDSMSNNGSFRYAWNPYSPKAYNVVNSCEASSASSTSAEEPSVTTFSPENEEDDDLLYAFGMIASLREEPTDASLQQTVTRLPARTHLLLLNALECNEALLLELLEKERGNVVAQLLAAIGGENCSRLVKFVVQNTVRLALNQSGCIAYSRIYEAATPVQQAEMSAAVLGEQLGDLCVHQFGNYVVQCILRNGDPVVYASLRDYMMRDGSITHLCANKFGSHVAETFIGMSSPADAAAVSEKFLRNEPLVATIAADRFGNYFVQHTLRRIATLSQCVELTQWCLAHIPAIVASSQYALNIGRSLGLVPMRPSKKAGNRRHQ